MKKSRYERLHREVEHYLAFWVIARTPDPLAALWKEYTAYKSLLERIRGYSLKS